MNKQPKIGILIVTYNAASTLVEVLNRIPDDVWEDVSEVIVMDDASHDATFEIAHGYKETRSVEKLKIIKNEKNLGYGGNQKAGYRYCIENDFDCVVLLHGDGQYKPELLKEMYSPIVSNKADAVFGTRMQDTYGGPLKGGMPLYKYVGNRILSSLQNVFLNMNLSEFHSGYRAYSVRALKEISMEHMTDEFHFDTEIIIKFNHQNFTIFETPIPTYYGDEICHVDGLKYAKDVLRSVLRYNQSASGSKQHKEYAEYYGHYPARDESFSSHWWLEKLLGSGHKVLDLGCSTGEFAERVQVKGNKVTGVDILPAEDVSSALEAYHQIDLNQQNDALQDIKVEHGFDRIIMGDILEHLAHPEHLLKESRQLLSKSGRVLVSLPNVANITVRLNLLFGKFKYTDRGILDSTHLRFYTQQTARELFEENGFRVILYHPTLMPVERSLGKRSRSKVFGTILSIMTRCFPKLLGFQHVFVISPQEND